MPEKLQPEVQIRAATPADSETCGRICYEAFFKLSAKHGFPCDFPGPEHAVEVLSTMFSNPGFFVWWRKVRAAS
jgi:hypothetical protein